MEMCTISDDLVRFYFYNFLLLKKKKKKVRLDSVLSSYIYNQIVEY